MVDDGFRDEFSALFRAMYPELCNFVVQYVTSRAIAEELVQDLFLRLWERGEQDPGALPTGRTYLYRAARNRALDHLKHERVVERTARTCPLPDDLFAPPADAELGAPKLAAAIDAAIQELPPRTRRVFVLTKGNGLTYAQVAEVMEISVKTVEGQMSRAFRILRSQLQDYA